MTPQVNGLQFISNPQYLSVIIAAFYGFRWSTRTRPVCRVELEGGEQQQQKKKKRVKGK